MTVEQLENIIADIKAQIKYENDCVAAFETMFPNCYSPVIDNPIWTSLIELLDSALGLEDFFSWWIWDTQCGKDHAELYEQDGTVIYVRNAEEIIKYAESLNKK